MCFGLFRFVRAIRQRAAMPDRPATCPDERAVPEFRHIQISLDSMDRHAVISAATCHVMSHILLLAGESQGARLKSDLESIGHSVSRLAWNHDRIALPDVGAQPGYPADLVVVDDAFPGRLPNRLQRLLRPPASRISPVLLITDEARVADIDFSAGITDFITQPYTLAQLETRLRLILGRAERRDVIRLDDLVINLARYEVRVNGDLLDLTLKEYELLKYLVLHRGRVFTRSDLLDRIWGYDYHGGMRTVDVHVARLRAKLAGFNGAISTVRGVGYGFDWPAVPT